MSDIREHVERLRKLGDMMTTALSTVTQLMQVADAELAHIEAKTKAEEGGDGRLPA